MFCPADGQPLEQVAPGVSRRILAAGGRLMAVQVAFAAGVAAPQHAHPHEQVSYIVSGRFEWQLGDQKRILESGDSVYVPPGVTHGVRALEASVILDVFTPQREDFLKAGG